MIKQEIEIDMAIALMMSQDAHRDRQNIGINNPFSMSSRWAVGLATFQSQSCLPELKISCV